MLNRWSHLLLAALPAVSAAATAQGMPRVNYPPVLSMRARATVENRILRERLDTIIPAIMRERGVDMWVLIARENFEDPVVRTMLDAEILAARRRTILIFHDRGARAASSD